MTLFAVVGLILLAAAAGITLAQVHRGPTNLDRIIALDVMLVIVVAGVAMEAARQRTATTLPLLLVLSMVGFIGGVTITRFMSHDSDREKQ